MVFGLGEGVLRPALALDRPLRALLGLVPLSRADRHPLAAAPPTGLQLQGTAVPNVRRHLARRGARAGFRAVRGC